MPDPLRVLVVEDEPVAAEAHATYVGRVPGFVVVAVASTGQEALRALQGTEVDVVLLDMNLPDRHGLEVVRAMRAAGHGADVIAVSSARDLDIMRSAVSLGVVQYVLKPFAFGTLRDRLSAYLDYRATHVAAAEVGSQAEVDQVFAAARPTRPVSLPKGMSEELLGRVISTLRESPSALSASEVAGELGVSRVTARRFLEHLHESGVATRRSRYSGAGRPEVEYGWRS
ncbi:chemotaxis protein CheY [Knoellia flava TL1]|uniref:Transcriptional regulatory protein n=2 Tax=Knoellia flava TaxID=913969 RepID=A0A8H9FUH9_9MICO|nr:response regulator [Knoellia flava]KGN35087.1 chemotaxis protein CheY [Knoellia flava TL1]GGB86644.1 transcriptional regulatory protein [Knoellia flava]